MTVESKRIVERLTAEEVSMNSERYREHLDKNCISCHANEHASEIQRRLGVDCQLCHGPAAAWGDEHYAQNWNTLGPTRFGPGGKVNLAMIAEQASVCASCHIGDIGRQGRDREVDHRLMAAGHPPMHFDFALYLSRYPKHWSEQQGATQTRSTSRSWDAWRVGKLKTAMVRVRLLQSRANRAQTTVQSHDWPEFTEYSCYRCHHTLDEPSWRQVRGSNNTFLWDPWFTALLDVASQSENSKTLLEMITHLRAAAEPSPHRATDFADIDQTCNRLIQVLDEELARAEIKSTADSKPLDKSLHRQLFSSLLNREDMFGDWETAAQWMIACRTLASGLEIELPNLGEGQGTDRYIASPRPWSSRDDLRETGAWRFQPATLFEFKKQVLQQLEKTP
jgi:hypothetical protein